MPIGSESQSTYGTSRPCFAIVEDQTQMAQLVSDMLTSKDMDVEVFALGADLPKSLNLFKFKTVILDLSLPDIDGFLLMDKLVAVSFDTPILIISGHSQHIMEAAQLYADGVGLNVIGVLQKPFSSAQLYYALNLSP
jgi:FixJ family two-component response regulator